MKVIVKWNGLVLDKMSRTAAKYGQPGLIRLDVREAAALTHLMRVSHAFSSAVIRYRGLSRFLVVEVTGWPHAGPPIVRAS